LLSRNFLRCPNLIVFVIAPLRIEQARLVMVAKPRRVAVASRLHVDLFTLRQLNTQAVNSSFALDDLAATSRVRDQPGADDEHHLTSPRALNQGEG
jgi:hypothetical protein